VIVAILVAFGAGYLAGGGAWRTQTVTSTSTITAREIVTSTITSTSTLASGQPISIADIETANLSLGRTTGFLAVIPSAGRVYDAVGSTLFVIDTSSHSAVANVTLPSRSVSVLGGDAGIVVDPSSKIVFVSVQGGIVEINGSANNVVGELHLNSPIGALAYDQATGTLYGSTYPSGGNGGNSSVVGWDVRTSSVVANISLGYVAYNLALNAETNIIYVVGCHQEGLACDSMVSLVNGTSRAVAFTVSLNSLYGPTMNYDPTTNVVYVSGEAELVALNGTNGNEIFQVNPDTCGPFVDMVVIPSLDQLLVIPSASDYLLVYDGASGALVNMYSYQSSSLLSSVVYNPVTHEIYLTDYSGQFLAFPDFNVLGHVNATLIGSGESCLPP
jgi:hypothetical protein